MNAADGQVSEVGTRRECPVSLQEQSCGVSQVGYYLAKPTPAAAGA